MRVVFCGTGWFPIVELIRQRLPSGVEIVARDPGTPVVEAVKSAEVVLPSNAGLSAEAIAGAERLRLIQQPAAGYDGIDLEAARARSIPVCNAPGTNGTSVAEAALLLILALSRRLKALEHSFSQAQIGVPLGRELAGQHLLLVGKGRSGMQLARIASAMGMVVSAVDSKSTREQLLARLELADVVSLHCPLDERTRHMFDAQAFEAMKPSSLLVNCARGPIIERAALEHALEQGDIGGVGLDVYWEEPWSPSDPLFARPNVITLPHVAGSTEEAFGRIAEVVAENIRRSLAGEPVLYRVA